MVRVLKIKKIEIEKKYICDLINNFEDSQNR